MSTKTRTGRRLKNKNLSQIGRRSSRIWQITQELLEYEEKIRRKAALQRMLRFASEENWEAFQQELRARPDLADHAQGIKKEAKMERMLRFTSEGNREAFNGNCSDLELNCQGKETAF